MSRTKRTPDEADGRPDVLRKAIDAIEKQFGKGTVMSLGEQQSSALQADSVPTGSLSLDRALGTGGYPRGRIVEIFGPESSGKTTLSLHAIAEAQRAGGVAAFIDAEHAFDVTYARIIGVDTKELLVSQPDNGEQALDVAEILIRSGVVDLVVVDSVAALVPRAEIQGDMGEPHVGLQARLMSQALRKLTAIVHRNRAVLMFINQIRHKIGVTFGSPETTTGGNALKFYASIRLDIRRIGTIKNGESAIASRTRVKVVKNKVAPPFREAIFEIRYGQGIHSEAELVDAAIQAGVVVQSGSWYSMGDERLGQGRENVLAAIGASPELAGRLRDAVLETPRQEEPEPLEAA